MSVSPISTNGIQGLFGVGSTSATGKSSVTGATQDLSKSFESILQSLSQTEQNSDSLVQKLAAGEDVDIHAVMIAQQETDINFKVAMAVRDKLVDAYKEVMRMSV